MLVVSAALSVSEQIKDAGAYAGLASILGLAVLSLLYFGQARELKRLRDWAGQAPERTAELQAQANAGAAAAQQRPAGAQPVAGARPAAAVPATAAGAAARPVGAVVAGQAVTAAGAPAPGAAPASGAPGKPGVAAAPAVAAGAAVAAAGPAAAGGTAAPTPAGATNGTSTPTPAATNAATPAAPGGQETQAIPAVPPDDEAPVPLSRVPGSASPGTAAPLTAAAGGALASRPTAPAAPGVPRRRPPVDAPPAEPERPRRSRGRIAGIVVGVVVVLGLIGLLATQLIGGDATRTTAGATRTSTDNEFVPPPSGPTGSGSAAVSPGDYSTYVLNGTTQNGIAAEVNKKLETEGYKALGATNAADNTEATTEVFFAPGKKRGALAVARQLAVVAANVKPADRGVAVQAQVQGPKQPDVIVRIGADKATP